MARSRNIAALIRFLLLAPFVGLCLADVKQVRRDVAASQAHRAVQARSLSLDGSLRRLQDAEPTVDEDVGPASPEVDDAPSPTEPADPAPAAPVAEPPTTPVPTDPPETDPPGGTTGGVSPPPTGTGGGTAPPPDDDDTGDDVETPVVAAVPPTGGGGNDDDDEVAPTTGGAETPTGGAVPPTGGAETPTPGGAGPPTSGAVPPTSGAVPPTSGAVPPTSGAVPPTTGAVPPTDGSAPPPVTPGLTPSQVTPTGVTPTATGPVSPTVDPDIGPSTTTEAPTTPDDPGDGTGVTGSAVEDDEAAVSSDGGEDSSGLSTGVVVAIVAGVAVLAALVIIVMVVKCCRGRGGKQKQDAPPVAPQQEAHPYYANQESMAMGSSYGYPGGDSKYYSGPQGHMAPAGMHGGSQAYSGSAYSHPGGPPPGYTGSSYSHTSGSQPGYSHTAYSQPGYSHTAGSQPGYSHGPSGMSPATSNAFMPRTRPHSRTGSSVSGHTPDEPLSMNARAGTPTQTASTFDVGTWRTMITQARTMAGPADRDKLERALDNFAQTQTPFLGRFIMLSAAHRRAGGQGVVQFARGANDGEEFAIKFFTQRSAFDREFELYSNPVLRGMMPAITHIEPNTNNEARSMTGWPMPPCIVIERGESLDMWALRIKPDFTTILQVLTHVATRLEQLHESGLVHRDLKPGNVLWRPQHLAWTLIDFGCAAHTDSEAPLSFSLKYAAPEIVHAYESKEKTIVASPAMDMWALGLMAYELLTDTSAFPMGTPASAVCDQITGRQPLPWEDPEQGDARLSKLRMLRRSLSACLSRDPAERPTSSGLLASWNRLFDSVMGDRTYAPS